MTGWRQALIGAAIAAVIAALPVMSTMCDTRCTASAESARPDDAVGHHASAAKCHSAAPSAPTQLRAAQTHRCDSHEGTAMASLTAGRGDRIASPEPHATLPLPALPVSGLVHVHVGTNVNPPPLAFFLSPAVVLRI